MFRQLIAKSTRTTCLQTCSFHSPFAVLSGAKTPSKAASKPSAAAQYELAQAYEKQEHDVTPEPAGLSGARTYVVSDPDPSHAPFGVKSGAYSVSEPFAP